jgi:hypothetical protein
MIWTRSCGVAVTGSYGTPMTCSTAFSPTDVMPLARWAKAGKAVQPTGSLAILGLVIARAVGILQ